jgi:AcrR family transcriptional regulator
VTLGRPLDLAVTGAIHRAALKLLADQGFARMTIEAIAREARVGKPAVYRRHRDKAAVVAAAITNALPDMREPPPGPARDRLHALYVGSMPADAPDYLALIGGLMAEHRRHPEIIAAFREQFLLPRRDLVMRVIAQAQEAGEVRDDLEAECMLDFLAGPILARTFAGRDVGPEWREAVFAEWWRLVATGGA